MPWKPTTGKLSPPPPHLRPQDLPSQHGHAQNQPPFPRPPVFAKASHRQAGPAWAGVAQRSPAAALETAFTGKQIPSNQSNRSAARSGLEPDSSELLWSGWQRHFDPPGQIARGVHGNLRPRHADAEVGLGFNHHAQSVIKLPPPATQEEIRAVFFDVQLQCQRRIRCLRIQIGIRLENGRDGVAVRIIGVRADAPLLPP